MEWVTRQKNLRTQTDAPRRDRQTLHRQINQHTQNDTHSHAESWQACTRGNRQQPGIDENAANSRQCVCVPMVGRRLVATWAGLYTCVRMDGWMDGHANVCLSECLSVSLRYLYVCMVCGHRWMRYGSGSIAKQ
uniref:Uncharacterized protein n=1 Tax=Vitrella brassicaformis TaxID=1169539 RepID=A0A7S1JPQ5_9ALVE